MGLEKRIRFFLGSAPLGSFYLASRVQGERERARASGTFVVAAPREKSSKD
jgi:hypothetical protein